MSPRSMSTGPVRSVAQSSWIRPERSTRSRKTSLPMSRRAMTRPATRRVSAASSPGSSGSASARTESISTRSGNRFGSELIAGRVYLRRGTGFARSAGMAPREGSLYTLLGRAARSAARLHGVAESRETFSERRLRRLNLEDLELQLRAARRRDRDRLALLLAEDRPPHGRLVRELVLGRIRLGRADDVV